MDALVADLDSKLADARLGGGLKAAEKMKGKGKMLPRERCVSYTRRRVTADSRMLHADWRLC